MNQPKFGWQIRYELKTAKKELWLRLDQEVQLCRRSKKVLRDKNDIITVCFYTDIIVQLQVEGEKLVQHCFCKFSLTK